MVVFFEIGKKFGLINYDIYKALKIFSKALYAFHLLSYSSQQKLSVNILPRREKRSIKTWLVLGFKILISNINKEIYISSIKLTSKFVCHVIFCVHGCVEPFKIKTRFFFIHQPLGNAISNSNRARNGTTSRYLRNLKYNLFCHVEMYKD